MRNVGVTASWRSVARIDGSGSRLERAPLIQFWPGIGFGPLFLRIRRCDARFERIFGRCARCSALWGGESGEPVPDNRSFSVGGRGRLPGSVHSGGGAEQSSARSRGGQRCCVARGGVGAAPPPSRSAFGFGFVEEPTPGIENLPPGDPVVKIEDVQPVSAVRRLRLRSANRLSIPTLR